MSERTAERVVVAILAVVGSVHLLGAVDALGAAAPNDGLALRAAIGFGGVVVLVVAAFVATGRVDAGRIAGVSGGAVAIGGAASTVDAAHPAWLRGGVPVVLVAVYGGLLTLAVASWSDTP